MATNEGQFDVFLSHNGKDKPHVRALADFLTCRGLKVWLDERELIPGRPWQVALEDIIKTVRSAAVIIGRDGLGPWEEPEMRALLNEFVRRKLPVIPVLLPDAPKHPELPPFLAGFTWVDLRGGTTEDGLEQLLWGITGVRPNRGSLSAWPVASPSSLPSAPVTTTSGDGLLDTWERKLD